jgi:hypothetical protein
MGAVGAPGRSRGTLYVYVIQLYCVCGAAPRRPGCQLPAQAELLDQRAIPADVRAGQVLEQAPTAAHQ